MRQFVFTGTRAAPSGRTRSWFRAIRNGGLFSSGNGVFDVIMNSSAGNDTQSRKKFILARPDSDSALALPQAKPMKIGPKYGTARLRISIISGQ